VSACPVRGEAERKRKKGKKREKSVVNEGRRSISEFWMQNQFLKSKNIWGQIFQF
jgi:hypothetical protein